MVLRVLSTLSQVFPYFCISYIKMMSFCAFPVIFIDTVTFEEGALIKKAGVRTPLTLLDPPLYSVQIRIALKVSVLTGVRLIICKLSRYSLL